MTVNTFFKEYLSVYISLHACVLSHIWLFCDPIDCSPPGPSIHGILQARILEWVAIPSPGDLPDPGIEPKSPALAGGFFTTETPEKPISLFYCHKKTASALFSSSTLSLSSNQVLIIWVQLVICCLFSFFLFKSYKEKSSRPYCYVSSRLAGRH